MFKRLLFVFVFFFTGLAVASGGYIIFDGKDDVANKITFWFNPHSFDFNIDDAGYAIQQNFTIVVNDAGVTKYIPARLDYQLNPSFSKRKNGLISVLFLDKDTINLVSKDITHGDNIDCRIVDSSIEGANAACFTNDNFKGYDIYTSVSDNKRYMFTVTINKVTSNIDFSVLEKVGDESVDVANLGGYHFNGELIGLIGGGIDIEKFNNGNSCTFGNMDYDFSVALSKTFGNIENNNYSPKALRNFGSWTCPPYEFTGGGREYRVQSFPKEKFTYKVMASSPNTLSLEYNLTNGNKTLERGGSEAYLTFDKKTGVMLDSNENEAKSVDVYVNKQGFVGRIEGNEGHLFFRGIKNKLFDIVESDESIYHNPLPTFVDGISVESTSQFQNGEYTNQINFFNSNTLSN